MNEKVDRFGAVASSLCAVHCALCALLPAALGALGLGFLVGHEAEWVLTLIAIAFGVGALFLGWRQHRSGQVAAFLLIGIVGLLASRGLEMGSDHHGHEEDAHHAKVEESAAHADEGAKHAQEEKGEHKEDGHEEGHEDGEEHDDAGHLFGAMVGVLAGLFLFLGHLLNIRALRKCNTECCD